MISQTADYALRAVIYLAMHEGQARTTQQIADATKVSPGYLSKILQSLVKAGIVSSQRGLHGGYRLAVAPAEVSLTDVLDFVDPIPRIRTCPLRIQTHSSLCALHQTLDDAFAKIEATFSATTVADLLSAKRPSKPLCSNWDALPDEGGAP